VFCQGLFIDMSLEDQMKGVKPYQFQKGQSGNPNGRPKGSKNRMKLLAEGLIGDKAKLIVKKVIEMALNGNEACLRMCMDRILPTQKSVDGSQLEKQQAVNIFIETAQQIKIDKDDSQPNIKTVEMKDINVNVGEEQ
jgi:hypothetical protein